MQNKQPESYAPHMYEEIPCNNKKEKYSPTLMLFLPITFIVQTLRFTHTFAGLKKEAERPIWSSLKVISNKNTSFLFKSGSF